MMSGALTAMLMAAGGAAIRLRCQIAHDDTLGSALSMRVIVMPAFVDDYPGRVHFGYVAAASDVTLWDAGG